MSATDQPDRPAPLVRSAHGTRVRVEVVNLLVNRRLAAADQILAVSTLVRRLPAPIKKIIGNSSDHDLQVGWFECYSAAGRLGIQ